MRNSENGLWHIAAVFFLLHENKGKGVSRIEIRKYGNPAVWSTVQLFKLKEERNK